jgi:putative glutamine amidotransferase
MANSQEAGPWIGVTASRTPKSLRSNVEYTAVVRAAGGVPVILPVIQDEALIAEYVRRLDGLLLSGGDDVPPESYGAKAHPKTKVASPDRSPFEDALLKAWLETGKPLLAICRGPQQVNVSLGGTLIQHLPDEVGEGICHSDSRIGIDAMHEIAFEGDSWLRELFGADRIEVNSSHHQAIQDVAPGLKVVARSDDGVIEALEFTEGRPVLLVQWHPERMVEGAHRDILFGAFIGACRAGGRVAREA